jgi:hypothetical protein
MTIGEFRDVLYELGLLGEAEWLCAQEGATLVEAHAEGEMRHQRLARVALYRLLRQKTRWSWRKLEDVFNRKCIRLRLSRSRQGLGRDGRQGDGSNPCPLAHLHPRAGRGSEEPAL